ncbi:hypothetical protein ACFL6U_19125 [Planctomycetota bacterium]
MVSNTIGLLEILNDGQTLKLSNGTLFRVNPFDLPEVRTWTMSNDIELAETNDRVFNYTLTNTYTDTCVRAMKLG